MATAGAALNVVTGVITNPTDIALPILISSMAILLLVPPTLFMGQKMTRGWLATLTAMFYAGLGLRFAFRGNDIAESTEGLVVMLIAPVICLLIQWLLTRRLLGQIEAALADSERLRANLEKQNRELDRSRELAEQANRSKSIFLANMSHELRTPLNAVIGYSELLAEDAEDAGHDQMLADIHKIEGAGKQLLSLINDVLDMAKIEAGHSTIHIERVQLSSLVAELELVAGPLVSKKHNTFSVELDDAPEHMHTDWTKLRQVLSNLISNAAKFTEDGVITLRIGHGELDDEPAATFALEDTGMGMDEATQGRVFAPFVQADESTTRTHGGTGLGLSLVAQFTELLGGRVELASTLGEGSTFTVKLPLVHDESAAPTT